MWHGSLAFGNIGLIVFGPDEIGRNAEGFGASDLAFRWSPAGAYTEFQDPLASEDDRDVYAPLDF